MSVSAQPSLTGSTTYSFVLCVRQKATVGETALIRQRNNKWKLSFFNNKKGIYIFPTSFYINYFSLV